MPVDTRIGRRTASKQQQGYRNTRGALIKRVHEQGRSWKQGAPQAAARMGWVPDGHGGALERAWGLLKPPPASPLGGQQARPGQARLQQAGQALKFLPSRRTQSFPAQSLPSRARTCCTISACLPAALQDVICEGAAGAEGGAHGSAQPRALHRAPEGASQASAWQRYGPTEVPAPDSKRCAPARATRPHERAAPLGCPSLGGGRAAMASGQQKGAGPTCWCMRRRMSRSRMKWAM